MGNNNKKKYPQPRQKIGSSTRGPMSHTGRWPVGWADLHWHLAKLACRTSPRTRGYPFVPEEWHGTWTISTQRLKSPFISCKGKLDFLYFRKRWRNKIGNNLIAQLSDEYSTRSSIRKLTNSNHCDDFKVLLSYLNWHNILCLSLKSGTCMVW